MVVYVSIAANEPLKIGIRSGNTKGDGTTKTGGEAGVGNMHGFFKVDNFTLTKVVSPTFANLDSLSVTGVTLAPAFDPAVKEYTCILPYGTTIFPSASILTASVASISRPEGDIDVTDGSDTYSISVTSSDETVTNIYTIHFVTPIAVDYTNRIVNANVDSVAKGIHYAATTDPNYPKHPNGKLGNADTDPTKGTFRPILSNYTTVDTHLEFYGWQPSDWGFLFKKPDGTDIVSGGMTDYQAMGIYTIKDVPNNGYVSFGGSKYGKMPENFEFCQTINNLPVGDYKVTCGLGVQNNYHSSQRLFANNNVQFYGKEADYAQNKTTGETYTYGGYTTTTDANTLNPMTIYVTIAENEPLKIGIRSGTTKGDGTSKTGSEAGIGNMIGFFKVDNFTLTRIVPTIYADLESLSVVGGVLAPAFDPTVKEYTCTVPYGTTMFPYASIIAASDAAISRPEGDIDVTGSSGKHEISVTSSDGTVTNIYTIHFVVDNPTGINEAPIEKATYSVSNNTLTVSGADYTVYNMDGIKIATKPGGNSIELIPGIYIVKTNDGQTFKVVI